MTFLTYSDKIKLKFVSDAFMIESVPSRVTNGYHTEHEVPQSDEEEGACALPLPKPEKAEPLKDIEDILQMETSKILELFPSYGVGYIRRLLAFYDNSSEAVILKILEGKFSALVQTQSNFY